jgi:hypothetical protein
VRKVRRLLNLMLIHVHADVIGDEIQDLLLQRVSHLLQTALHLNLSHVLWVNWCNLTHEDTHRPVNSIVIGLVNQVMKKMEISLLIYSKRSQRQTQPPQRHQIEDLFDKRGELFKFKLEEEIPDV